MKPLKKGQKVKVLTNGIGCPLGFAVVTGTSNNGTCTIIMNGKSYTLLSGEFITSNETKEDILEQIKILNSEQEDLQSKLDWMAEAKIEEYNDNEHKIWRALTTIEGSGSKKDKVKILAKLMCK